MRNYSSENRAIKPSYLGDISRESKPEKPCGKYKFHMRINRLEWSDQIEPLFAKIARDYRPKGNQHYGKINIIKEIKENGEIKKIEKEINIRIDFRVGRPCFLNVEKEEDLEDAHRKVLDALSGR